MPKKRKEKDLNDLSISTVNSAKPTLNPLKLFPAKADSLISQAFLQPVIIRKHNKISKKTHWLENDHIDPEFGIQVIVDDFILRTKSLE